MVIGLLVLGLTVAGSLVIAVQGRPALVLGGVAVARERADAVALELQEPVPREQELWARGLSAPVPEFVELARPAVQRLEVAQVPAVVLLLLVALLLGTVDAAGGH